MITYKTDAVSGSMEADSLADALEILDSEEGITDTLTDGSWAWVEDAGGNRLYLGRQNM
jgi:hypothetical protein